MSQNAESVRRPSDEAIAEWVKSTCMLFGASAPTAYIVAAQFVLAINEAEWAEGAA